MIELSDGWILGGPCPHCGGEAKWERNLLHIEEDSVLDVGHFDCTVCGERSKLHRLRLKPIDKYNK